MKASILFFSVIMLISIGCNRDHCEPEMTSSIYIEGKNIVVSYDSLYQRDNYEWINGPFLLFEYYRLGPMCDDITDEDWVEKLYFAIPDSVVEFKLVDSFILETNCYYQERGAWYFNQQSAQKGIIEGNKIGIDKWKVKVDIVVNADEMYPIGTQKNVKFEQVFVRR